MEGSQDERNECRKEDRMDHNLAHLFVDGTQ
jgi:hypothetical protein